MLDQLDEKERLRNNFISNLTHDFRTPLIAQTRSLELLIKDFDELGMSQQAKLGRSLVNNNQHLLGMVNQLLETYQFEGGNLRLELEPLALEPLVDACFVQLLPLAETRQITLEKDFPAEFPTIIGDANCLNRVFINLIANGIENIPKGSRIRVTGQRRDAHVEIHVRDNGQGVSADEQANLFDRYYAGMGDTRKLGSGLGLYICKMFVEAHQGQIQIDSVPGEYTDFKVRLPLQPGDSGRNESTV
jgi:two-component system sensor histidine kinase/response regulator